MFVNQKLLPFLPALNLHKSVNVKFMISLQFNFVNLSLSWNLQNLIACEINLFYIYKHLFIHIELNLNEIQWCVIRGQWTITHINCITKTTVSRAKQKRNMCTCPLIVNYGLCIWTADWEHFDPIYFIMIEWCFCFVFIFHCVCLFVCFCFFSNSMCICQPL